MDNFRRTGDTTVAFYVSDAGYVSRYGVARADAVCPSFYLKSNIALISGDGSKENPFRLSL